MNENEFWKLIDRVIEESKNDPYQKFIILKSEVQNLSPEAIFEFAKYFHSKMMKAGRWDLWAAAYIIGGGCSDDTFVDFRASLVCAGKKVCYNALQDPDSLVNENLDDILSVL